jgi:hypothetical protein
LEEKALAHQSTCVERSSQETRTGMAGTSHADGLTKALVGVAFNAFRLRAGVIKRETCDNLQDKDNVKKNNKVTDETHAPQNDKVIEEKHVPKNVKASAEIAIPKSPNVQDKFEVTMNNVANHPANIKAFDFDKTVQMAKTYLDEDVPSSTS